MPKLESLGIKRVESLHYYVRDLERSRRFYCGMMDLAEVGESGPELTARGRQKSVVFQAGECAIICSTPVGEGGRAHRYLQKHPDGIGTIAFEVEDVQKAFTLLDERGGTPIGDIESHVDGAGGEFRTFSITTPVGDTTFRFVERRAYAMPFPGFAPHPQPHGGKNAFAIAGVDHVTSNFQTMKPALLWMEHVLGLEQLWHVEFHTDDAAREHERKQGHDERGSGLRSIVMWDSRSGVKFANNEPWRPFFKTSQINIFNEEHHGDGVQHVALATPDIVAAVRGMRARGVAFMPTPAAYYELLPKRLERLGIAELDEDIALLKELEILVDGEGKGQYLLQIFLKDAAGLYGSKDAGPFFYEIIQRKGSRGFGAGNFRALFESIEREQKGQKDGEHS
ncbi:MAG TPA: VOC family protein [Polyangiaceae bacterium]|nr:VOC family protein [Polyangiaceae bacterium]